MRVRTCGTTALWLALALSAGTGCGGVLTGTDPGPPLIQLKGTVSGDTVTPLSTPYAEFLWTMPLFFPDDPSPVPLDLGISSGHALVPIQSQLPASFTLNLYAPPPDSLIGGLSFDAGQQDPNQFLFSLATVLVFDDVNRDGDFNLVDAGGQPTSAYYAGDTFAPDLLRGWLSHGAVMYVAQLPDPKAPALATVFANPEGLRLGFQTVTECHLAGTTDETRLQVLGADAALSLHLAEPTTTAVPESQALWFDDATTLPDCVP